MKYLGIKPFREYSKESLTIHSDGIDRHGVFYEYQTNPSLKIRYIYIEQPTENGLTSGYYHVFEVNLTLDSSNLNELIQSAKDFASMIISYGKSLLQS